MEVDVLDEDFSLASVGPRAKHDCEADHGPINPNANAKKGVAASPDGNGGKPPMNTPGYRLNEPLFVTMDTARLVSPVSHVKPKAMRMPISLWSLAQ